MKNTVLLLIVLAVVGCQTAPVPGWETCDQDVVLNVARAVVDAPEFAALVREVDTVYMNTRTILDKQNAAALTARWFRESKKDDLARLRALKLGASDAELIVGVIVAGGMNPTVAHKPLPVDAASVTTGGTEQ